MQQKDHTQADTGLLRQIAAQVRRYGHLTVEGIKACLAFDQEITIFQTIAQLTYLTEDHIAACTNIPRKNLSEMLDSLCERGQLEKFKVKGVTLYWIELAGLRRVGKIVIPGLCEGDLTKSSTKIANFCRSGVSNPVALPHLLKCADLAVRLYTESSGTVIGERMLRLLEKINEQNVQIGTSTSGHCPDVVVVSSDGKKVTGYEAECSCHPYDEGTATCRDMALSGHLTKVYYVTYSQQVLRDVERRIARVEKELLEAEQPEGSTQKFVVVRCKNGQPPAVSRILAAGTSRRSHRRGDCEPVKGLARAKA